MILFSVAVMILVAMGFATIFEKIKLPPLLGMIVTGVMLGANSKLFFMNKIENIISSEKLKDIISNIFIDGKILEVSTELRALALIVILIRAGLGINRNVLNKIGVSASKMAIIPCLIEGLFIIVLAHYTLGFSFVVSGVLAFIIAASSPAVIVPEMLRLKDKGYGKKKEIPTLILAGASVDDVIAITLFGAFLGMAGGENINIGLSLLGIPVGIVIGVLVGGGLGFLLIRFFEKVHIRDTKKTLLFLIIAIFLYSFEKMELIPIASLLGIMVMGFVILEKNENVAKRLAAKFNKVWVLAEIILFVLIGTAVDLNIVFSSGLIGLLIIVVGLIGRSVGVFISLKGSELNSKERLFCGIAYTPKATVQAAIGGIPLAMGVEGGEVILAIAVLAIVVTAPLGAIGIRVAKDRLLNK